MGKFVIRTKFFGTYSNVIIMFMQNPRTRVFGGVLKPSFIVERFKPEINCTFYRSGNECSFGTKVFTIT